MDVKETAIRLVCVMYEQMGEVIKTMVNQSDLNELLKKKVMERLETITCSF